MKDNLEVIIAGCTGLIVLAVALYGSYRLHRHRVRQQQCFDALQVPCPVCESAIGSPCVNGHGAPAFLHWPRVTASFRLQRLETVKTGLTQESGQYITR
jgi:hypothetical protein